MSGEAFNVNISFSKNWDHLQNKYVGTGHADYTKYEWAVNQHRDTICSHLGHADTLLYFSTAENKSVGRIKHDLKEKLLQPVGPPPVRES